MAIDIQETRKRGGQQASLEEEVRVHALGKDLVSRLAMLFKTVRIHSVHNSALQYSVKIFVQAANDLFQHLGDYTLRGDVDSVFINDIRIRPEAILWDNIVHLLRELGNRGVGGITFAGTVFPVGVRKLLQVLLDNDHLDLDEGPGLLNEALRTQGVNTVTFLPRMSLVTDAQPIIEEEVAKAFRSIRVYTELVVTWKAYLAIREEIVPDILRSRLLTAVQAAVDMLHDDPDWFVSASSFRKPTLLRVTCAVNTAILAMAVGHRLEFSRKALMNLGMASLYATSGLRRFGVDDSMRIAPGSLADTEGMEVYPLRSIKEILQTPALTRAQRDRILVAYEHRIGDDGSGFPRRIKGKPKHLFSGIVSLCSRFVDVTAGLPGQTVCNPSEALEVLTRESKRYDSRLLAVFIRLLGPFPIGTVVELSTGEHAVVFRQNPDRRFQARPLVKIVRDSIGRAVPPALFDLTDGDTAGTYLTSIRRAVASDSIPDIDPAQVVYATASEGEDDEARPSWDMGGARDEVF
jgi:hypothetical protein